MNNDGCLHLGLCAGMIILLALGYTLGYIHGSKEGQVDAMTGKVYYCLEKQDNSEFTWEYHSEGCK